MFVTGCDPYQTFSVTLRQTETGSVFVQQSSFRSPDVCFDWYAVAVVYTTRRPSIPTLYEGS